MVPDMNDRRDDVINDISATSDAPGVPDHWWRDKTIYQIYPRSFQDSNGDGVGDIPGIISRLDYLAELGIGAIWLSPVYQSPNRDNGYDISDYQDILGEFGTMSDMENLIREAGRKGIRVIMDLVVNHTSDRHPWFIESRSSRDSCKRDFYIWRNPGSEGGPPNRLASVFSGSAWKLEPSSGQYYLHLFSEFQPDLNWENEELRQQIYQMMNFWIDKGIGGFRMDVIDLIGKAPDQEMIENGPKLHEYLQEMNRATFGTAKTADGEPVDLLTVGETWSAKPQDAKLYSDPKRRELSMIFQFEHIGLDEQPGKSKWDLRELSVPELKRVVGKWQTELGDQGWNSLFWNNHDTPRIVSRWGDDREYRDVSAKMLAILLHFQKGTPYIYQGEEIGMTNLPISSIDEADDIESINMYHERRQLGYSDAYILRSLNAKGRDNARTPIQWDKTVNAGFSTGIPWLRVNPNYTDINVAQQREDPCSIFHTYQKLVRLRKANPVMVWGEFSLLSDTADEVIAYTRTYGGQCWLVVASFSKNEQLFEFADAVPKQTLIHNYDETVSSLKSLALKSYEAFAVEILYEAQKIY
jgi:glucan 1,6-alpha-glucosidase